jgi:Xaa-Pro aminopeptidase
VDRGYLASQPALLPVKDSRADKKVIGIVRNGFHMRTASAVTDDDGAAWLSPGRGAVGIEDTWLVGENAGEKLTGALADGILRVE